MATVPPIKYFLAYYGENSYMDLILRWNGSGTRWTLYQVGVEEPLYAGDQQSYTFVGVPNTNYQFRIETTVDGQKHSRVITTYTTALPAPTGAKLDQVSDSAAVLTWNPVKEATGYEIGDVTDSYRIAAFEKDSKHTFTKLDSSTRYSFVIRTLQNDQTSKWSAPVTFSTNAPDNVDPGVYDFRPEAIYTWAAGRPGSTDPKWLPAQSDWFHGDGFEWGDNNGVQTTFFFFGASNPFHRLYGAVITKCEVYLSRYSAGGDPGRVLSRLSLHRYASKPDGEPVTTSAVDAGTLARGEAAWVEVPVEWGRQLSIGAFAKGWSWGGVPERYEMSKNLPPDPSSPRIGDVRITVG